MPELDTDTFTYADGALDTVSGGKWTQLSGFNDILVASNALSGGAGDKVDVITSWSGSGTSHYSQCVQVAVDTFMPTVTVYSDAVSTFYLLETVGTPTWDVYKCVGGSFTSLNSVAQAQTNGDTVYMENQAGTIVTKRNGGAAVNNFADGAIASGKPGLFVGGGGSAVLDNWAAGDFAAAGAAARPSRFGLLGVH